MAKTTTATKPVTSPQSAPNNLPATTKIDQIEKMIALRGARMTSLIPSHLTINRVKDGVVAALGRNPDLMECTPTSIVLSALEAAECGLSLSPTLKEADILKVWDNKNKCYVAQFRPRYGGLMKLARQSKEITKIFAHAVREGDEFRYAYGLHKDMTHVPKDGNKGALSHAYCVWTLANGETDFVVMDRERILEIKGRSESGKRGFGPWLSDEEEMWRKTCVRNASKYMPLSADPFLKAVALDNEREGDQSVTLRNGEVVPMDTDGMGEMVDITAPSQPAPKGSSNLAHLEARVMGAAQPPADDGDPGPGAPEPTPAPVAKKASPKPQVKQEAKGAVQTPAPQQTKPWTAPVIPVTDTGEGPDWATWYSQMGAAINKIDTAERLAEFEAANEESVGQLGFINGEMADDVRALLEARMGDLTGVAGRQPGEEG